MDIFRLLGINSIVENYCRLQYFSMAQECGELFVVADSSALDLVMGNYVILIARKGSLRDLPIVSVQRWTVGSLVHDFSRPLRVDGTPLSNLLKLSVIDRFF